MFNYLRVVVVLCVAMFSTTKVFAQDWSINPADFEYNAAMTAQVLVDGQPVSAGTLAAFVGDELRGLQDADFIPFGPHAGEGVFNIQLRSNVSAGETMTFKYSDGTTVMDISETYDYSQNDIVGNLIVPNVLNAVAGDVPGVLISLHVITVLMQLLMMVHVSILQAVMWRVALL